MSHHSVGARRLTRVGLLVTLAASLGAPAIAQESSSTSARAFGGHLFIPSTSVPDPFVSTTVGTTTGFGTAVDYVVPVYNLDREKIGEVKGSIGAIVLEFNYQQAIKQRFAVRVAVSGGSRAGASSASILASGISAIYGYGVGGSASLIRKSRWQLTATADVRGNTIYAMSPLDFVRGVVGAIAAGDTAGALQAGSDSLLQQGNNVRVLGGLRAAYTPAPWIGFTGYAEAGLGDKFFDSGSDTSVLNGGATVSFDLNPLQHIPVGLLGTFRGQSLGERNGDRVGATQGFGLGIFYTGRQFFAIGLENTWEQVDQPRTDTKIDVVTGRIVLRYDFN